ncbi:hypothetical protein B9G53_08435 [Pseudanabaena sp. SR411]|uniref:hypothetical protein n=1 Tax=Pseudanabaena sp. SR411 TaxID=1980935 RepID=UPI000B989679|nr:hypothetical protein [Pseudanabaena sp. SR411]OYQ65114.1 hypothetical protein B9G53_08435 [Pseudanabaena sp. SR411]
MNKTVHKVGFWSGFIAFFSTVAFVIVQMLQLFDVLSYPLDEILIYGFSLCIVIPFLLEMLALHYIAPTEKKFWSHAALIFTVLYVAFVTANYVVQLATVIPMTLQGTSDEILILRQTPHSLFWDFDAIGYIFMGFATLFAIPIFEKQGFQRWVRYSFLVHSLVTPLIVFVYFYPNFTEKLLLIAIPWGITAPLLMLLLAIMFKKDSEVSTQTP